MNRIYKGKGDKDKTSWYSIWASYSNVGDVQNNNVRHKIKTVEMGGEKLFIGQTIQAEFRPGRCLEGNMFVLTQCIKISVAQNRALSIVFLDIKGAYDNVDRELAQDILKHEGIDDDFVELLREIYSDN